jgi:hypothetical protein
MSKYHNIKTEVDDHPFDSKKEASRYAELKLLLQADEISELELQPKFRIEVNRKLICSYFADFRYWDYQKSAYIIEDVKGVRTPVYRLKKKLVEAVYGIVIVEI